MVSQDNNEFNSELPRKYCRYWRHILQRRSKQQDKRIVFKSGEFNIEKSISGKCRTFPHLVTAFTEARWRWTIIYCVLTYVSAWLVFALIWWIILFLHGDLEPALLPDASNTTWKPCVSEINSFTSVFLFSIEVHTTIGYGKRTIMLECPLAILTMCIESITGKIIQSLIIGIVFAKLTRPKNRAQTLIFSKNAIISQRDRNLCLIFRLGNLRKARIIGATISAYLIKYKYKNQDMINFEQIELKLQIDSGNALFAFPVSAVHVINKFSPFYNISAYDILKSNLEVLVVFEGTIESTGQIVQAKSSYTNSDILWGRRFVNLIHYQKRKRGFVIDYSKFDEMNRITTPLCSANELDCYYEHCERYK